MVLLTVITIKVMRLLIKFLFIYQFIVSFNSFSQTLIINENSKLVTIKNEDNSVFVGKIDGVNKKGILTFSNGDKQEFFVLIQLISFLSPEDYGYLLSLFHISFFRFHRNR